MGYNGSNLAGPLAIIEYCYASGEVKGVSTNGYRLGGLIGIHLPNGSTLENCVALNKTVTKETSTSDLGRLWGYISSGTPTVSNNKARADMKIGITGSEAVVTSGTGATTKHGEDVPVDNTVPLATIFSSWDATTIWNIPAGNLDIGCDLPTLKVFGTMTAPTLP